MNKVLEVARTGKLIGSSLEAKVYLFTDDASLASRLREMCTAKHDADTLQRIFIISQVSRIFFFNELLSSHLLNPNDDVQVEVLPSTADGLIRNIPYSGEYLVEGEDKVWIGVSRAEGSKCERCWNYSTQVGSFVEHPTLCSRCYEVLAVQPIPSMAAVS